MSKSAADIVADMIATLQVTDPELDTSIGSTARKILDVVGEQIAPAYADAYLSNYVYSVDTKSGADLDDFCAMFGLYRLAATRATGVVAFSRLTPATTNIEIPANTEIGTGSTPEVLFVTVAPAVLVKGTTLVSVPVQAEVAGQSGNLPSDSLTNLTTPLSGITSTTAQGDATTGGTDAESDDALRERFKKTVFRSLAGTEDMFLAVAIEDPTPDDDTDEFAIRANVIGASKRWREQVQVGTVGTDSVAISTIPAANVRHVFVGSSVLGEDIDDGSILTEGVHYTFDTSVIPPRVVGISDNLDVGSVYDLDFEYVPKASRNDPDQNITNRVDIWVSGEAPQQASETTYYRVNPFVTDTTDPLFRDNFIRTSDNGNVPPTLGNMFLPLAWGPIIDFPESLTIGDETYLRDTDYWVVHDDTGFGYSSTSLFGLEWLVSNQPASNSQILLTDQASYFFNALPAMVEERAEKWKLVTTDLKVHQAKSIRLVFNFAVMYDAAYDRGVVQSGLDDALTAWMNNLGFHSVVQISDILNVAHNVPGVDNVRFLNSAEQGIEDDPNSWGIQSVSSDGTHIEHFASVGSPQRAVDHVLAENEVPVFYNAFYITKAQNTFREPG